MKTTIVAFALAACGPLNHGGGGGNTGHGTGTPLVVAFADEPVTFTSGGAFALAPGALVP